MRMIDRPMRPLFPDDFHGDTQVVVSLMSSEAVEELGLVPGSLATAVVKATTVVVEATDRAALA